MKSVVLGEGLHRKLKTHCAEQGVSIKDFAGQAISEAVASVGEKALEPLTKKEISQLVKRVERILDSGDPLAVELLSTTVNFWERQLSPQ